MSSGGNVKGVATGGLGSIPAASRKVVQSVKEIVNCPEAEIYAMLRECNMDPNEAVSRLLTQDTFREVKSKREKKKESKDTTEYRPRSTSNASNYGGRSGTERRGWSTQYNYSESGNAHEKPAYRKENGVYSHAAPNSSVSVVPNAHASRQVTVFSDSVPKENKLATPSDSFASPFQTSSGFQSAWGGGTAGQLSMADIVKKGRPQNKAPGPANSAQIGNHKHVVTVPPPVLPHDHLLCGSEPVVGSNQQKDEWPSIEPLPASNFPSFYTTDNIDSTSPDINGAKLNIKSDDAPLSNDGTEDNIDEIHGVSTAENVNLHEDDFGDASYYDNNEYEDPGPYQQYGHDEAEDHGTSVSNVASNMQQLSLERDEHVKEGFRSVVIPDHLQVQSSECLNLSFGSFGLGTAAGVSGTSATGSLNSDVEQQSEAEDASPDAHSDFRNADYIGGEQSRSTTSEDLINRSVVTAEANPSISHSQPEVLKQDIPSEAEVTQYASHTLAGFDNSHQQQLQQQLQQQQQQQQQLQQQQLNAAYFQSLGSSQGHNQPPFSNVMAYANLAPGSMLAQQPVRESDLYSQFHTNQSMASKFGNQVPVGGPSTSGAEDLETSNLSLSQQVLPSANNPATGPGLSQHLAMHPYSQPNVPLGPFTNMISYPFLPQSYTYMPSSFQQAFGGNSSYHPSLAAMLPQYKNNMSVSSLPQSGAVPSGYGVFGGSSTNVPGNYLLNQNAAPSSSTGGYDERMSSHYKQQLLALQQAQLQLQHENLAMHAHGNSRTMSTVPPSNTYYNFQGQNQNQQAGVLRQNLPQQQQQPPSQHFGSPGYPDFYHSQSGMSMEQEQQQQQNPREGAPQVQTSKQTQQQMWQNGY